RRWRKSRPLRPMTANLTSLPSASSSFQRRYAIFSTLALNAPARPRSEVRTTSSTDSIFRFSRSGCVASSEEMRAATELSTSIVLTAYGRRRVMFSGARRSRAAATSFIARVIFCVLLTLPIRLRICFRLAIGDSVYPSLLADLEGRGERLQGLVERRLGRVVDLARLHDVLEDLRLVRADVDDELGDEARHLVRGARIEVAVRAGVELDDLLL